MPVSTDSDPVGQRCASQSSLSHGRRYPEPAAPTRNDFQRDRDRVIHSTAFRRLVYKTQVFLNHEGDLFRTRLTHSLEVAQLGRSIARVLGLNEDLVEAISLAHDLGHTPFGHAGQDALNTCMVEAMEAGLVECLPHEPRGGFEHNMQSLRVVDELEERYPAFNGLNLCYETREGILKHCSRANAEWLEQREPGGVGARFLLHRSPSLEAQLANLADEIAYNAHDIDDGVRSGLLTMDQVEAVPLFARYLGATRCDFPALKGRKVLFEAIRRMLSDQIYDVIDATTRALKDAQVTSVEEVRCLPVLVQFSANMRQESQALKQFLFRNLYRHPQVMSTTGQAQAVVAELFRVYCDCPAEMPAPSEGVPPVSLHRRVADYIAGMTDRFALREHERLTGRKLFG